MLAYYAKASWNTHIYTDVNAHMFAFAPLCIKFTDLYYNQQDYDNNNTNNNNMKHILPALTIE